jgi:hypothetical protein
MLDPPLSEVIRFDPRSIVFDLVFPVWFRLVRVRFIPCIPCIPVTFGLFKSFIDRDAGDSGIRQKTALITRTEQTWTAWHTNDTDWTDGSRRINPQDLLLPDPILSVNIRVIRVPGFNVIFSRI